MSRARNLGSALALVCMLGMPAACFTVDHFPGEASRYDGLYFGAQQDAPLRPLLEEDVWRSYAIWGFVPWRQEQIEFAGRHLGRIDAEERPSNVVVHTELSFLNGLASFGVSALIPVLGSLIWIPRTTEVTAWRVE